MGTPLKPVKGEPTPGKDVVHLPDHYARFKIEPVRFVAENGLNFLQGNVLKYLLRYPFKNGKEDLLKARRYLDMLIAFEDNDPNWWTMLSSPERNKPATEE